MLISTKAEQMTLPTGTADVLASDRLVVQTCQKKKSSLVISNDFFFMQWNKMENMSYNRN